MKMLLLAVLGLFAFSTPVFADAGMSSALSGSARLWLMCTVDDHGYSKLCRFYMPVSDDKARRQARAELGWLDAHPFLISGATPGTEVKVLVWLNVAAAKGTPGFDISMPPDSFPAASGPEVTAPVWVMSPHDHWADAFLPERAARMNEKGEATVRCLASETGMLANCWVMHETPSDANFGEALLLLLHRARIKPFDQAGDPVAGRAVVVTLKYDGVVPWPPHGAFDPHWSR